MNSNFLGMFCQAGDDNDYLSETKIQIPPVLNSWILLIARCTAPSLSIPSGE